MEPSTRKYVPSTNWTTAQVLFYCAWAQANWGKNYNLQKVPCIKCYIKYAAMLHCIKQFAKKKKSYKIKAKSNCNDFLKIITASKARY